MTFSKLDFKESMKDPQIVKMFLFLDKHFSPEKKKTVYVDQMKKTGLCQVRTSVKYYNTKVVIDEIINMTNTPKQRRQAEHFETWKEYVKLIQAIPLAQP